MPKSSSAHILLSNRQTQGESWHRLLVFLRSMLFRPLLHLLNTLSIVRAFCRDLHLAKYQPLLSLSIPLLLLCQTFQKPI